MAFLGDFWQIQLIYKGKTNCCHPRFSFTPDWHITHYPNHWSTEDTMSQYVKHIVVPYVNKMRGSVGDKAALVIMDNFKGQVTKSVTSLLEDQNIHTCLLPANTTDLLQPKDISVNTCTCTSLILACTQL